MKNIYVFDWDNTLINSHEKGIRCTLLALDEFGIKTNLEYLHKNFNPDYHKTYAELGISQTKWKELDESWLKFYNDDNSVELFSDVYEVLAALSKNNLLGLITTGQRTRVYKELNSLQLFELFNIIICREDVNNVKPHPEAIDRVKLKFGSDINIVYIGDHENDIEMARQANVSYYQIERKHNTSPLKEYCISDLKQLLLLQREASR